MSFARLKNALLHYRLDGPTGAPVVVLSNSLGTDLEMWDAQIPALTARYRLLRYDTRGHGRSTGVAGPYTLDDLGGDVVELLDHLRLERVHVCGISLGGMTSLWLALHVRDRILSIVPCNTAARIGSPGGWDERIRQVNRDGLESIADATMQRWFTERFRKAHPEPVELLRRTFCTTNVPGYTWCCSALRDADLRDRIPSISAPVLILSGTHDPVTPPSDSLFLEGCIRGSRHVELDAAHLSNIEDAESFTGALTNFLATFP